MSSGVTPGAIPVAAHGVAHERRQRTTPCATEIALAKAHLPWEQAPLGAAELGRARRTLACVLSLFIVRSGLAQAARSRRAFPITESELVVMAAPASMGLSSKPVNGYSAPAATGIASAL